MNSPSKKTNIFSILKPYLWPVIGLALLAIASSGASLIFPKIISNAIDSFTKNTFILRNTLLQFGVVTLLVFIFTYLQTFIQTYTSERVGRDLREKLAHKISQQSVSFIEKISPSKLLTNLTSDIDSIKTFIAQAISTIISSLIIIIGASILLFSIDWRLALAVLTIVPLIGGLFFVIFGKVKVLIKRSREMIDWLNKVINESIFGASLIRILNSQQVEYEKFFKANAETRNNGLQILKAFATMIPLITFIANLAVLVILSLGGHFIISGTMTLGDFTAFNSYIALLIFPIIMIGVMSNFIAQATASYERISEVLESAEREETGSLQIPLQGNIKMEHVNLKYGEKPVLKDISFSANAKSRTAIIGPTGAGKTLLLSLLIGVLEPDSGSIQYDGLSIHEYEKKKLHEQIGLVFQDSIMFNLSIRENIAFSDTVQDTYLEKAIKTAELTDFINELPDGLNTIVSERGASLSGGQKQRIMLARALALNPKILLLDDFTARVDAKTEGKILKNIITHYPDLTLISVTQKISSIESYDQIIVIMEGEIIASGTHEELLTISPEYVQIFNSQKSTHNYE